MMVAAMWSICRGQRRAWQQWSTSIAAQGLTACACAFVHASCKPRVRPGGPGLDSTCVDCGRAGSTLLIFRRRDKCAAQRFSMHAPARDERCVSCQSRSDGSGLWLALSEAEAIGVDGGVLSALGLEETHRGSDTEGTEDTVPFEGRAGEALKASDPRNPDDTGDSHGADTGNWILTTAFEGQEDRYENAGAHTESQHLKRSACFAQPLTPQEPNVSTPPLGTMPGIIRRKRAHKPSGTRPKAHAQHGAAASPGQATAGRASFSLCDPMSFHALAFANGFHMASSLVMAHGTHWAQQSAQRYDSQRNYPHLQRGPADAQLPEAVPETYRQRFFPEHYQVDQILQLKAQSKAQSIKATSPSHPAQDKNAQGTTGGGGGSAGTNGGCLGHGEGSEGAPGKLRQEPPSQWPRASRVIDDDRAATNANPERHVIAQVHPSVHTNSKANPPKRAIPRDCSSWKIRIKQRVLG
jgi:hypothetical protein